MKRKLKGNLLLLVLLFSFFDYLGMAKLSEASKLSRLNKEIINSRLFREQRLTREVIRELEKTKNPGLYAGLYLLESNGSYQDIPGGYSEDQIKKLHQKWAVKQEWVSYQNACYAVWNDLRFFPIPNASDAPSYEVSFVNSWMRERTYGGKRGHEGTDIMATKNERGVYPVLSMTEGKVTSLGWLPQGGWRIGITAPGGAYFYYAHLDSYADLKVGDHVQAGEFLGYMGDSGYGEEGTVGKFPVHLHVGIYLKDGETEISVNPYWILRYLEKHRLESTFF